MASTSTEYYKIKLLGGSDGYETWARRMKNILIEKKLWAYVSGRKSAKPGSEEEQEELEEKQEEAIAVIANALEDKAANHIGGITDPVKVWAKLEERYRLRGYSARFILYNQVTATTLASSKSMEAYIDTMKSLTSQLESMGYPLHQWEIHTKLLGNVGTEYEGFVSSILAVLPLNKEPDVEDLCYKLLDESRRRSESSRGDNALLASNESAQFTRQSSSTGRGFKPKCSHCGKP